MSASARDWNKMIDDLIAHRFIGSRFEYAAGWRHPWQCSPWWDPTRGRWCVSIAPGCVNGLEAVLSLPSDLIPTETKERLGKTKFGKNESADVFLSEGGAAELVSWRAVGMDANPEGASLSSDGQLRVTYEAVPAFFANLGVGEPPKVSEDATGLVATEPNSEGRLLRALDLVLRKDRPGTRSQFTSGAGVQGQFLQWSVSTQWASNARRNPVIRQTSKWRPRVAGDPLQELMGLYEAEPWDELVIATIWMVSPVKAAFGSDPNEAWTPYVQQHEFWNLAYATNQPEEVVQDNNLTLQTGLAGGVGDVVNQYLLAQVNDANSAVSQWMQVTRIEGRFWTV